MTYQYVYTPTFHQFSENILWKSFKHHRYIYDHHYRRRLNIQYPTASITVNLIALMSKILRLQERPSWKHRTSVLPVLVCALVFFMISVLADLVSGGRQLNAATTSTSPSTEIMPEDSLPCYNRPSIMSLLKRVGNIILATNSLGVCWTVFTAKTLVLRRHL